MEKNVYGYVMKLWKFVLPKDVGENGMFVKEIPQDPVWLDPQTECLDGVNRNRTTLEMPWESLVKPIVALE